MKDLRDFIAICEPEGLVHRVKAEVDWNLELSHVAKLNEEKLGPALLFEKVKGYTSPVMTSVCTTTQRLAVLMRMPKETSLVGLMEQWVKVGDKLIPPVWVDRDKAPCKENIMKGSDIDLFKFPVPKWYPKDGGRFIGTAHYIISKDPDSGWINLGTYRSQLLEKDKIGTQFIKGKHADIMLKKYQALKKPMPVASVIGGDPLLFILGAARLSAFVSEYDVAGAITGAPIEVVKGETVDLPIPAHAEIVIEGLVDAEKFLPEGPFGEYTGYYSGVGTDPRNFIDVQCVTFRNNPILWGTTVGRAVTDTHMTMALSYGSTLWQQLTAMKIPGIKSVYCPPEGSGRFLAIISLKQMYPGHADQVLDRGHLHGNGRLRAEDRHRGGRRHRCLGHPPGHVRPELPLPAQPQPGHQTRAVHAVGSIAAHRFPGHHRAAAPGCHHSLRLEGETHSDHTGPGYGQARPGPVEGIRFINVPALA